MKRLTSLIGVVVAAVLTGSASAAVLADFGTAAGKDNLSGGFFQKGGTFSFADDWLNMTTEFEDEGFRVTGITLDLPETRSLAGIPLSETVIVNARMGPDFTTDSSMLNHFSLRVQLRNSTSGDSIAYNIINATVTGDIGVPLDAFGAVETDGTIGDAGSILTDGYDQIQVLYQTGTNGLGTFDIQIDSIESVPEPASLALLGLGGAVLLAGRRRRA